MKKLSLLICSIFLFSFYSCNTNQGRVFPDISNIKIVMSKELSNKLDNVHYDFVYTQNYAYLEITYTLKQGINQHPQEIGALVLMKGNVWMWNGPSEYEGNYSNPEEYIKIWNTNEDTKINLDYEKNGTYYKSFSVRKMPSIKEIYLM